ncbi:MAG TPA: hypothetical protein PKW33_10535 [Anaerolineaceae bacterium]|nr:hypothetical protein [Anaerolineaceae bacterium]HPN52014.1 hypothetical protein [Anaerolineaceae bacterium]
MFRRHLWLRIGGVIILIGLMLGVGFAAYRFGIAQGLAQAPEVAQAFEKAGDDGQAFQVPFMLGRGHGFMSPFGHGGMMGFFPFGALCGGIIFLVILFGALRLIFFRPMRMGWGPCCPHGFYGPHGHPGFHHGHPGHPWKEGECPECAKEGEPEAPNTDDKK